MIFNISITQSKKIRFQDLAVHKFFDFVYDLSIVNMRKKKQMEKSNVYGYIIIIRMINIMTATY